MTAIGTWKYSICTTRLFSFFYHSMITMVSEYLKLCKTVVYSASKKPNLWPFSPGQRHFFFISGLVVTWTKFCSRYTFWCETNAGEHSTTFTGKWWIWKSKDLKYMCDDFRAKFDWDWPTRDEVQTNGLCVFFKLGSARSEWKSKLSVCLPISNSQTEIKALVTLLILSQHLPYFEKYASKLILS